MELVGRLRRLLVAAAVLIMVVGMAVQAPPRASAQDAAVSIDSLDLPEMGQGSVELRALNVGEPGLGAWLVDIAYDSAIVSAVTCTPQQPFSVCNEAFLEDTVRVAGTHQDGLPDDSTLAIIIFACRGNGRTSLNVSVPSFVDAEFNEIGVIAEDGSITCGTSDLAGDVDCDGVVNSIDAALILQVTAGLLGTLQCPGSADVSEDGNVDSVDAALILQFAARLLDSLPV